MIGILDIGNTRAKFALFTEEGALSREGSVLTSEAVRGVQDFFSASEKISKVVIGSVVPSLTPVLQDLLSSKTNSTHVASSQSPWGFKINVEEPGRVGIDRLANMEAALSFSGSVIVVDAGTATKFDLLEGVESRAFVGGAIAPGMMVSYEALMSQAAQLSSISLEKHSPVVGYNTETAIRSGVLHGFAAQVDGMIMRFFEERGLPRSVNIVATGGNAVFLKGRAKFVNQFRPRLTLEGLYALSRKV